MRFREGVSRVVVRSSGGCSNERFRVGAILVVFKIRGFRVESKIPSFSEAFSVPRLGVLVLSLAQGKPRGKL